MHTSWTSVINCRKIQPKSTKYPRGILTKTVYLYKYGTIECSEFYAWLQRYFAERAFGPDVTTRELRDSFERSLDAKKGHNLTIATRDSEKYYFAPRESEAKRRVPRGRGKSQKNLADRYSVVGTYRRAISRACDRAFPAPEGLDATARRDGGRNTGGT
jgi:hypothetical protein